ncbi:MAG: glycosyltransferase family 2 protein [Methylococcales symbiont of Hymedesmia sp. n. MRB-2018]|nr:MAG: glycosyltransferase family 2 protein [Methylococcales symbiont of Hymedesmia sp. n. MRB-2018]ORU94624.1 MAG: hypothetical protein A6F72_08980 [Cycloclasticus sp. symbiont of Poecilosclerida sp. N]
MTKKISVSVIVPVFNTGKLLFPCLRSLLAQTLNNIEVIIVDDGSDRQTQRICEKISARFPDKIKLIRFPFNRRQGAARNMGIKVSQGEYIGLVDSDDYIALDMYEKLYTLAKVKKADIVDCDLIQLRSDGSKRYEVSYDKGQTGCLDQNKRKRLILRGGRMVTKIVKRSIWIDNNIQYPEGISYEDNAIASLHLMYTKKLAKVDEGLYFYRDNPNSTTHKVDDSYLDRLHSAQLFLNEYKKRGFYDTFKPEVEWRFVGFYYLNSYRKIVRKFSELELLNLLDKVKLLCPDYRRNIYFKEGVKSRKKRELYLLERFPKVMRWWWRL